MKIYLRMHRTIYETMMRDLRSAHQFASERVGFLSLRFDELSCGDKLVLFNDYSRVRDEQYLLDPTVGARINAAAIREAMQRVLDSGDGACHVHLHRDNWPIGFSPSDRRRYDGLIPALRAVRPEAIHGALVLNSTKLCGLMWPPDSRTAVSANAMTIVGFPSLILQGVE
jgi:hypothetical protein